MGRPYKFDGRTVTSSFRIPEDLFGDPVEYKNLRMILDDYIEKFYDGFKERKRFKENLEYIKKIIKSEINTRNDELGIFKKTDFYTIIH